MQPQDVEAQVPASPSKAEQAEEKSMETFFKEVAAIKVRAGVGAAAPSTCGHVKERRSARALGSPGVQIGIPASACCPARSPCP